MKSIVCSILFANLLALGTLKTTPLTAGINPGLPTKKANILPSNETKIRKPVGQSEGDTVIVKLKNKNKVLIITDKGKDLGSFRTIDINKIISDIDSTLQRDSALGNTELDVRIFRKDSTLKIRKTAGDRAKMRSYKIQISADDNAIVVEGGDTINREVRIYTGGNNYRSHGRSRRNWIDDVFEIDLGFNNYLESGSIPGDNNKPYGLTPWNSNYVALRGMKQFRLGQKSRFRLSVGLEIAWNNFKFDGKQVITKGSDTVTFEPPADASWKISKSKLTASWLNVPLMLHYRAKNSSFHVAAGGFVGYRMGSHSKIKYDVDGNTKKDHVYTNFYLNSLQYGARFQIGFHDVDFFAQYNLNELFASGKGPKLTPFAFGITL